jgi:microcin C transport system substrate-binding protein
MKRSVNLLLSIGLVLAAPVFAASPSAPVAIIESHAFAEHGEPKYGPTFTHFDYVNPTAPKGGELRLSAIGTYDNFNRYASRGDAEINSEAFYDSLMIASDDEIGVLYPLIAESIEYPEDYTWVAFNLNPAARFQDGTPIRAEDVVFSFNKFMDQGVAFLKTYYQDVKQVEALSPHKVKFTFARSNRDYLSALASFKVLPKQFWAERDLSEPLNKPPLGSGPYKVVDYNMGQSATYERIDDYWAADLPSRKGQLNFKRIRYDYYRDHTVALEAFKAGEFDFRQENIAKQWAEGYQSPAVANGDIIKAEVPHKIPQPMQAFVFNTQRELFKDRRVRKALNYLLDFEWLNKNLFYSSYTRNTSYFENTPYKAQGKPSGLELKILSRYREQLPKQVFGPVWRPNKTQGDGNIRGEMRQALRLLKAAGWELKEQKLVNAQTGKPFAFEMLLYSPSMQRVVLPFKRNLERIGIELTIRMVDSTQYLNRLRSRDFDMTAQGYRAIPYPSANMKLAWHSDYIDSTYNQAGVANPVLDALLEDIEASQEDEQRLLALGRAFDRVALWNFYVIPQFHSGAFRVAYWDKFAQPKTRPKYAIGIDTWWLAPNKAKALDKNRE